MKLFWRIIDNITKGMAWIGCACIAFALFSVCLDVFVRKFFGFSFVWVFEVTEYMMVFMGFLGAAWVLKEEGHVAIDIVLNAFRPRRRELINAVTSIFGAMVTLVIAVYGGYATYDHYVRGVFRADKSLELPAWILLSVVPVGFLAFSLQFIQKACRHFQSWKETPKVAADAHEKSFVVLPASDIS